MTEKIIMGIDPGTNVMGYGLIKVKGNKASMMAMGVIDMRKMHDPYLRLGRIFERVTSLIDEFYLTRWPSKPHFWQEHTIYAKTRARTRRGDSSRDTS